MLANGAVEKGIEHLRLGIRLSPLDERAAFWGTLLARALFRTGDTEEAVIEAKRACQNSENVAAARIILAVIELVRGNNESAKYAFDEAKRIDPSVAERTIKPLVGQRGIQTLRQAGFLTG